MIHAFAFFTFIWTHHHHFGDLAGWLRYEYPGMPGKWYLQYARWLISHYGTGGELLMAVRPW